VIKASNGHGGYWTKGFAVADDFEEPDGTHVLTFHQAGDAGKALARGKADSADSKPMTVADALARYKIDLKSRDGDLSNATRVEKHLTRTLAGKPVALLTVRDLQTWRNGLKEKMEPSSVNRTRTGLRGVGTSRDARSPNHKPPRVPAGPSWSAGFKQGAPHCAA
jgi:hypothetical protein